MRNIDTLQKEQVNTQFMLLSVTMETWLTH